MFLEVKEKKNDNSNFPFCSSIVSFLLVDGALAERRVKR